MDFNFLEKLFKTEPAYRFKQAKKAIFYGLIEDWSEATVFPLELREILNQKFPLTINGKIFFSKDKKTAKAAISLEDGYQIESVLMQHKDGRNTICVSSQVGCPLGCSFCATGSAGFKRNLKTDEIVSQVLFFARYLKKEKQKITNIVFMGMGEPFLNYENVVLAIRIINNKEGFNLGARHISISTVGITEGIEKLAKEGLEINLAISLHAPDEKLRSEIMPVNKKYPIKKILVAVDEYIKKTKRRVMIEYIMIKDLNDSEACAEKLAELINNPLYFVNLISYNPTGIFKPSLPQKIKKFKGILEKRGIAVTERYRFGDNISAACGQLASSLRE